MKIKSIKTLNNVGLLNEIAYTNCNLFTFPSKKENKNKCYSKSLIKGNNGTGKTTFSNLFYSIEKNDFNVLNRLKRIDSIADIDAEIELEDGTIIKYDNKTKRWLNTDKIIIKVFNEDYIKDNINLLEFDKTNRINGKYETQEVKVSIEKNKYETSKKELEDNRKQQTLLKQELELIKTKINNTIVSQFDAFCKINIDYNKILNEPKIEEEQLEQILNSKTEIFKKYKTAETFKMFSTVDIKEIDDTIKARMIELLKYVEDQTKIEFMTELLNENEEKRKWIDTGMTYIKQDNLCPFCHKTLENNNIIKIYKDYKNSAIKEKETALNKCRDYFNQFIENKNKINELNLKINSYLEMINKSAINIENDELEKTIKSIIEIIDKKINNMQNSITEDDINILNDYILDINSSIEKYKQVNQQANEINKKMGTAKIQLTELRKEIKDLKMKQFINSNLEKISSLNNLKKDEKLLIKQFDDADKVYKKKLLDSDIVTKELNGWLKFFGISKYVIDDKFNLKYANNVINSKTFILSTGEISIITFSYFLTMLLTGLTQEEKDKLVIIIDDPVNSVDYNKIYSFATAIKSIQNKINMQNNPQLFVLTHNILLYNILVQSSYMKNPNAGIFELYKNNNSLCIRKVTHSKDTIFINYLKQIINIAQKKSNCVQLENVFIYNCIRTVIENFKYLLNPAYSETGDDKTIKDFFELDDDEYSKLDYIVNHNSHNEPELSFEPWFDEELLKDCCVIISNMVEKKYNKLYEYCVNNSEI